MVTQPSENVSAAPTSHGEGNIPRLDEMSCSKDQADDYTQTANDDVRDTQERILATDHRSSRDQDRFRAVVEMCWEICCMLAMLGGQGQLHMSPSH
jgi:hypothetical protein